MTKQEKTQKEESIKTAMSFVKEGKNVKAALNFLYLQGYEDGLSKAEKILDKKEA